MAKIKVDYTKLSSAKKEMDNYIEELKNETKKMESVLKNLKSNWNGKDYDQLMKEFDEMQSRESTTQQMIKTLTSYSEFLEYAEKEYKKAQSAAVKRANNLPK